MLTADGVEFTDGMEFWTLEGEIISSYAKDDKWVGYPSPWDEDDQAWVPISNLYSSAESAKADRESDKNRCFVCNTMLREIHGKGSIDVIKAIDGLIFRATGNYGSRIFDPMNHQVLEIVICDECVKSKRSQVQHYGENDERHQAWLENDQ